jgi:hypothetical protein
MRMHPASLLIILCLFSHPVLACENMLDADISNIKLRPVDPDMHGPGSPGTATTPGTIRAFGPEAHVNDDCTLDCSCVFDRASSTWHAVSPPGKICVFSKQCSSCKSTATTCQIRFVEMFGNDLYQADFYAGNSHSTTEQCTQKYGQPMACKIIPALPSYSEVKQVINN